MTMRLVRKALAPVIAGVTALALVPVAAAAAPATDKTWVDAPETRATALDIVSVRRVAAAEPGKRMRVVIRFAGPIAADSLEVHFDTDLDPAPEVWFSGSASSEFEVFDTDRWRDNDTPVGSDCGRMRFALGEKRAVVTFDPQCLDPDVQVVRVNVQTYFFQAPHGRDFAPARHTWLSRTAAYAAQ